MEIISDDVWNNIQDVNYRKYPWDEWLDGKTRVLSQGEDFLPGAASFTSAARAAAGRRQVRIRTKILDAATVRLQALRDGA